MGHKINGYVGHIEDFDLSLYRGAYQIRNFTFKKKEGKQEIPFITIKFADISVAWRALFKGKILADLKIVDSRIDFIDSSDKKKRQLGIEDKPSNWINIYEKIVPFSLERFQFINGEVHFQNKEFKAPIDLYVNSIDLDAQDIHNSKGASSRLVSKYKLTALVLNKSKISSDGSFNILSKPVAFDVNLKMEKVKLIDLNRFLLAYGPFDITSGTFSLYSEIASNQNKIKGYIKPVFEKVDVVSGKEHINSLKRFGFEYGTAILNLIFRDGRQYNVAAKVPISGDLNKPSIQFWEGFNSAFKNAFGIKKVENKIDNEINLNSVPKKK